MCLYLALQVGYVHLFLQRKQQPTDQYDNSLFTVIYNINPCMQPVWQEHTAPSNCITCTGLQHASIASFPDPAFIHGAIKSLGVESGNEAMPACSS